MLQLDQGGWGADGFRYEIVKPVPVMHFDVFTTRQ